MLSSRRDQHVNFLKYQFLKIFDLLYFNSSANGDDIEIQNTISWALDSNATDYVVYWDSVPGVTASSREVVPSAQGFNSITHSGADVVEQSTHYYRVQAISANGSSALSAEVAGTPLLSITGNQLNDVAWNGVDDGVNPAYFVIVGNDGMVLTNQLH